MPDVRRFGYRLTVGQCGPALDPVYQASPIDVRLKVAAAILNYALVEKDRDLAEGLDAAGEEMAAIAESTRKNRRSEMGPADPSAPPLTPAYRVSRTRHLLTGEAFDGGAEFWWKFDRRTGDTWGRILDYHRNGGAKGSKVRDVIGMSDDAVKRTRDRVLRWWADFKRGVTPVVTPTVIPDLIVSGRTDYENFTFGIGASGAPGPGVQSTGFVQRRPGAGGTAFGGPGPFRPRPRPRPPTNPSDDAAVALLRLYELFGGLVP